MPNGSVNHAGHDGFAFFVYEALVVDVCHPLRENTMRVKAVLITLVYTFRTLHHFVPCTCSLWSTYGP